MSEISEFIFESTEPGMDHFRQIVLLKIRVLLNDFLAEGGFDTFRNIILDTSQNDPSVCLRVSHNVHRNAIEMARQLKNSRFPKSLVHDQTTRSLCNEYYSLLCPHHFTTSEYGPCRAVRAFGYYIMQHLYTELQHAGPYDIEGMLERALHAELEIRTNRRLRHTTT